MPDPQLKSTPSNRQTIFFMVVLSFVCALILSLLASALSERKEIAKDLDRSKQMMIAAKILTHAGNFILQDEAGKDIPAKYNPEGYLVPSEEITMATGNELLEVYKRRLEPLLVDSSGKITTFQEAGLKLENYLTDYKKTGFYKQPLKLIYAILPNRVEGEGKNIAQPVGYVIPVNGLGLWDAIYGYLALKPDGNTVIGISWYDQKETPGLGANIADFPWQNLFPGKKIFQESISGKTDYKTAPIGIAVVKGRVTDVFGNQPKSKSAVDGMAGATLTGNGVTDAYRDVLSAYRPFLLKLQESK